MQWPSEITAAFDRAIDVEPVEGTTKSEVVQYLLDETARRAVWRAKGEPAKLETAYRFPYTPLGSVTVECLQVKTKSLTIKELWNEAVDLFYAYVRENAQIVCYQFRGQQVEYCDEV